MKARASARRKSQEGGFALLLIFLLAACIGIYLYMQVPRNAFEAQRIKEQLLMDRGHEYQRAVQLYFRKFKRYPQKIEDLENTTDIRFLRHRYKDPMTGKDEWRILHMGPAGYLTDSLVDKPPTANGEKAKDGLGGTSSPTQDASMQAGDAAQQGAPGQQQVSAALAHRPSDVAASAIGTAGAQRQQNPNQPFDPNQPYDPSQLAASQTNNPAQPNAPNQPNSPTQPNNGQPQQPNVAGLPGGIPGQLPPMQQPAGATPAAATQPTQGAPATPNAALGLINQLLTTPRQPPAGMGTSNGTLEMQGGIAGVASKDTDIGIMRYHDRKKYSEWEFVYDYKKDQTLGGGAAGAGTGTGTNPGMGGAASQSGFGQTSTTQSSGGFTMGAGTPPPPAPAQPATSQ